MDLRSVLAFVRRSALYLVVGLLVGTVAAFVANGSLPRVYQANSTLLVGQQLTSINPDYSELLASQQLSRAYAVLAETRPVRAAVVESLGLDMDPDDLIGAIRTSQSGDGTLVDITVQSDSPADAAAIANSIADEIVRISPTLRGENADIVRFVQQALADTQGQLESAQAELTELSATPELTAAQVRRVDVLEDRITSLRSSYAAMLAYSTSATANLVTVFDRATVPVAAVWPRLPISLAIGAIVGLLLALLVFGVRDYLDDSVKSAEDVDSLTELPTLGSIQTFDGGERKDRLYSLVTLLHPRSASAEAFRTLRTNLDFASVDAALRTVAVTSGLPGEGKTTVAANLAVAFAQSGRSTILVDSDLRRPDIHTFFRLRNEIGLTTAFQTRAESIEPFLQDTEVSNLRVLTAGPPPPNPAELLASQRAGAVLEQLKALADVVVLDSPPLALVTDGALIAAAADGTVLVVRVGRSSRAHLRSSWDALDRAGARILGVALNGLPKSRDSAMNYYYDAPSAASGQAPLADRGVLRARQARSVGTSDEMGSTEPLRPIVPSPQPARTSDSGHRTRP